MGVRSFILRDVFVDQLQRLNPEFLDHLLAGELFDRLNLVVPNIKGNLDIWEHLRGLRTVFVPGEKRERDVKFLDTDDVNRNTFHVTDEFRYRKGRKGIRPDVVFLVNGVPVVFVEAKAARRLEGMAEALEQVRRYEQDGPELMAVLQVVTLTHILKFYYGPTWNLSRKTLINLREETPAQAFEDVVKYFFDPSRLLKLITDYILFVTQDDELKKVVLRPHQIRAIEKVVRRAMDGDKNSGLIWHTQGSGKTYSMIVAAKLILEDPASENPTIIMLVDRNELETQMFNNLEAVGFKDVVVTESKRELRNLLERDTRGLFVSLIHKFEGMPANVSDRRNIFVLVDEAHRTTGGTLGNYLMGALPNATYIGFTGTPIDSSQRGRSTFVTFGHDDPPKGYLDKYGIAESVSDGATVPLHYSLAPSELRVDKETLNREFLELVAAEGLSDLEELDKVLDRAVTLKEMMKNKDRMAKIAEFVATHYKEYVEPMGYKAFLVGVDREACALYKSELDKHLPAEYSRVVYSAAARDRPLLAQYHIGESDEKAIRKAFIKADSEPKILVVTEKLLTGFDAPILYAMYLDKPMRDHVLLQAIARVNRPYEDAAGHAKQCGFIMDFVGIFDDLEKALAFDSADITGVVEPLDILKRRFEELMEEGRAKYLPILNGEKADKAIGVLEEYFLNEDRRDEYYEFYKELSDDYEILSPDVFLRPFIEDYETFTVIYFILREAFGRTVVFDHEFTRKTRELVRDKTTSGPIVTPFKIYEVGPDSLKLIDEGTETDTEKVFNLIKTLEQAVAAGRRENPYLIPIGERAEKIAQRYWEKVITAEEALREFKTLFGEYIEVEQERAASKLDPLTFTLKRLLTTNGATDAEPIAKDLSTIINKYPNWLVAERDLRELKRELYMVLKSAGIKDFVSVGKGIVRALQEAGE